MKRKVLIGLVASSLLVAPFIQTISVAASEFEGTSETLESSTDVIPEVVESTVASDVFSEPLVSVTEELQSETIIESTDETIDFSSTDDSVVNEEVLESSTMVEEDIQYEDVFYNGQWFKFPVQPATEEPEVDQADNHELGTFTNPAANSRSKADIIELRTFTNPAANSRSKADIITEKQIGRPQWDFIDVASYQEDLSVKDYEYMKKHGVTGVVVKLTEGTYYKNPYAKTQIENAKKAGLKVSTYHFSRFTTKEAAEKEAAYYAAEAKRLNLLGSTVMVNDLEVDFNVYSTQNSVFFANKLKQLGYGTTVHYSSAYIFDNGILATEILGPKNLWVAQYPYKPSDKNILHTSRSAWQWSSSMQFTEIKNKTFDVNMDHSGLLSNKFSKEEVEEIKPISEKSINKYATITGKGFVFWDDLSFKKQNTVSDNYFEKTLYVDKEFTYADGLKFVSVKDNKNQLIGYLDSQAIKYGSNKGGIYLSDPQYVTVRSQNYTIWQNFNFSKKRGMTSQYYNQTVQVRGKYNHFNGSTYYTLYTNDGKWIGYVNATGVRQASGKQGIHFKHGKYVTLKSNYKIWKGFSWKSSLDPKQYKGQTFEARGYYNHFNGSRYLSLYTNTGKWLGYINEKGVSTGSSKGGAAQSARFNKKIVKRNYTIWSNFNFSKKKGNSNQYLNQTLYVKVQYRHFNGSTYYSLYNSRNQWLGYINANATK